MDREQGLRIAVTLLSKGRLSVLRVMTPLLCWFSLGLQVVLVAQTPANITAVSGSGQTALLNTTFGQPLVAEVTDASGNPVSGQTVTFSGSGINTTAAVTGSNGQATTTVTANSVLGGSTVAATVTGVTNSAIFTVNNADAVCSATTSVTSTADSGIGSLRQAVADVCPGGTVNFNQLPNNSTITLSNRIYIGQDIAVLGPVTGTITVSGNSVTRILFVQNGNVSISNLTLASGVGRGGSSLYGGGGAGMGGAIFQNGGNLTLTNVILNGNQAVGGSATVAGDAGGGFGGNGYSPSGNGASGGDLGGIGGSSYSVNGNGGDGGGGGTALVGFSGGFGGGGGAGKNGGGAGGFGGGGGAEVSNNTYSGPAGTGGFGATSGAPTAFFNSGGGGAGAGFGGAIFERTGTLKLISVTFSNNSSVGGGAIDGGVEFGQAKGGALFVFFGAAATLRNVAFSGNSATAAGVPGIGSSAAPYSSGATCPGFDTVNICGRVSFDFGSVNVCPVLQNSPAPCSQTQTLTFNISASDTLAAPKVLTSGVPNLDFVLGATTCAGSVTAGNTCNATVTFAPIYPGLRQGVIELVDSSGNIVAKTFVSGTGVGPQIAFGFTDTLGPVLYSLSEPRGLAVDAAGDIFTTDVFLNQVVEMPAGGCPNAGCPTVGAGLSAPNGVAVDGAGNIFIADTGNNRVVEVQAGGLQQITVSSGLNSPYGVAVDGAGNVFIADTGNNRVVEVPAGGGGQATIATGALSSPYSVALDAGNDLFIVDRGNNRVIEVPAGGCPEAGCRSVLTGLNAPWGVAVDAGGDIFVTQSEPFQDLADVIQIPPGGCPQASCPTIPSQEMGVAVDAAGDLFFASPFSGVVELQRSKPPLIAITAGFGTTASSSLDIENSGNANLTETGITLGTNFSLIPGTGNCTVNSTLVAGAVCNLTIGFTPTSSEPVQSSATLTNNSLNHDPATQTIALNGYAYIPASVTLVNLAQTYNGTPLAATAITNPSGLTVALFYSAPPTYPLTTAPPTNAGSYGVSATVTTSGYSGMTNGILAISQAAALVTLGNLTQRYSGSPISPTATTTPAGLAVIFTYSNSTYGPTSMPPTAAGIYAVVATVHDTNYSGSATGTLTITASGLGFIPVTPCRLVDTRGATSALGGPTMSAGSTRSFPLPTGTCGLPSAAAAYSLNVTVVPHTTLQYLSLWPTGQQQPLVSTLNSFDGRIVANAAIVPAGANGAVSVYVTDETDVIIDVNGYFGAAGSAGALSFVPVTPCRIEDTRSATGTFGGPVLSAGSNRSFPIPSSACSIPSTAAAYSLNATVVPTSTLQYLALYPGGSSQPYVSTLNSYNGQVVANAAIVPAGTSGAITAYVTDQTELITDINGYFTATPTTPLVFNTVTPCRVADTRDSNGTFGGPIMSANSTRSFPIPSSSCGIPSGAAAYALNVTVVPTSALGYLTIWPDGQVQPLVSTLNSYNGQVVANAALVPAGTNGAVDVFVTDLTHVIIDIVGYFSAP